MSASLIRVARYGRSRSGQITLRSTLTFTADNVEQQLKVFPEYSSASDLERSGNYNKATPLFERVLDISKMTTGSSSEMTSHMVKHLVDNLNAQGKFDKAIAALNCDSLNIANKIRNKQLVSKTELLRGNAAAALIVAEEGTALCEGQSSDATDITLFSACYSGQGLSYLSLGNLSDAESFLQLSARWAQTPLDQMIALCNLGACSLYALDEELISTGATSVVRYRESRPTLDRCQPKSNLTAAPAVDQKVLSHRLMKEASGYWEEALGDAQKTVSTSGNSASAMCGPVGGGEDALGMTGLGSKVLRVDTSSTKSSSNSSSSKQDSDSTTSTEELSARLKDVRYAVVYCNLLCNLAELSVLHGDTARRDELVASALKALEGHSDNAAAHPTLGRVLSLAAIAHMEASQAVTAEGLFRSAIEKLGSQSALHDPRFQYERAVAVGAYGSLLCQWEKREAAGETMTADARRILDSLPKSCNSNLYLSSLVQFPV